MMSSESHALIGEGRQDRHELRCDLGELESVECDDYDSTVAQLMLLNQLTENVPDRCSCGIQLLQTQLMQCIIVQTEMVGHLMNHRVAYLIDNIAR